MVSKLDNALRFHEQALGLRAQRQQVLAGNIANADTPHFKARDFDFASTLKEALAGRNVGDLQLATTASGHINGAASGGPARLMYRTETQSSVDGNTVDMDIERSQFAENSVYYEAGLTFLTGKIKTLMSAIQSQ